MRESGLQHLLSISGLHIGLVAGLVFLSLRALLALAEPVALRFPIKKWAAVAALLAVLAYMTLVGAAVPTLRSVLMTGVMLLAVLADRNPFSMRVVALAAAAVLLFQPDAMLGPSFQMSFGAVVALIAAYEWAQPRMAAWRMGAGPLRKAMLYVFGVCLTSLVAGTATMPFALYHFQQVANYGLLANLLAVPVTSFWVMPCGLLAYLLMPLGLEGWAVEGMGWGIRFILWTAHAVAALPGAVLTVPAVPVWALASVTFGGLWLMIWLRPWRMAGLAGIALFVLAIPLSPKPDLRINDSGSLVGLRMPDGGLLLSSSRSGRFEAAEWQQRDGLEGEPKAWPKAGTSDGVVRCDSLGCQYRRNGKVIALVWRPEALMEDCRRADLVIAPKLEARQCPAPLVIDALDLARRGAHALSIGEDGRVTLESVRPHPGARPWN
ncbi:ComEC/Rec2 family competence protein [Aerophototrophica crusticola]|uniref:ComEC/Rec2 family competence protein n=1 Tax=Aerophototrophica crusticola TaxID=1709002 RepID=A0A858R5Z6_9PROT|nr:ComEC/Rec2 family competence protein [Rhodospirillaceae bacterium B3]